MHHVYCITNGNKKILAQNQELLSDLKAFFGDQFQLYTSQNPDEALAFIHQLDTSCTHLLCVGGDGTFNTLVNGVCTHPNTDFSPILGVLPNGTGNDFYRSAGYSKKYDFLTQISTSGFDHFDVGMLQTEATTRYFANIADVGFGGAVVLQLQNFRKRFGPNFSYGLAIIQTFLQYKRPRVSIHSEHFQYNGELLLAAFCNGNIFGDGLYIHPGARINDGRLKLTLLGKVSLFDYVKNVLKVKRGKQIKHPEAHYLEVSFPIELNCEQQFLHAETDGEYIGGHHFKISLLPKHLKMLPVQ
ncbi:MAG: diacylglycerol/lipid kinase family protein [Flavobacteriales bacterium]